MIYIYNATLKTNIGKEFLKIIDKHFPMNKPLSKIFNRKTIKIGYSCANNMNKIITNHNKRILNEKQDTENTACNCRTPTLCPVNNKCQTKNVIYKATLKNGVNYIGMTSTTFKTRYNNHIHSFKTEAKKTQLHFHNTSGDTIFNPHLTLSGRFYKNALSTSLNN